MHILLLLAFQAVQPATPVRSSCSSDAAQIAVIAPDDRVEILSALAGEDRPCYKVAIEREGKSVTGYVLGEALPAIQEFAHEREKASAAASDAQARLAAERAAAERAAAQEKSSEKEADTPKDPSISTKFLDFSGRDSKGKFVSLSDLNARATLVTFWSPKSKQARAEVMSVMPLYNQFHASGLAAVSFSMDPNPQRINDALDDVSPTWPQIPDRSGLAAQYNVDQSGKAFVLDSAHRIVAAGPMGPEIEKAVRDLLGGSR